MGIGIQLRIIRQPIAPTARFKLPPNRVRHAAYDAVGDEFHIHFTTDCIANEDGCLLFPEGSPPYELGAHPCRFRPDEIGGGAPAKRNSASTSYRTTSVNSPCLRIAEFRHNT